MSHPIIPCFDPPWHLKQAPVRKNATSRRKVNDNVQGHHPYDTYRDAKTLGFVPHRVSNFRVSKYFVIEMQVNS